MHFQENFEMQCEGSFRVMISEVCNKRGSRCNVIKGVALLQPSKTVSKIHLTYFSHWVLS